MNKDKLKKHHFWILLGLVPLFVLIAVIVLSSSVGAKTEDERKAIKTDQDSLGKQGVARSTDLLAKMDEQVKTLKKKQTELHEANWDAQKHLFTWPSDPSNASLKAIEGMRLKFGDRVPNDKGQVDAFKNVYLTEFSNPDKTGIADQVAPTPFAGTGWQSVLRHVGNWGEKVPTSDYLWLALEDIWVQRAVLLSVRRVNELVGDFKEVPFINANGQPIKDKLRKKFRNRIWEVEVEVKEQDGKRILSGRLINITDRLQPLGEKAEMTLRVWLDFPGTLPADPDKRREALAKTQSMEFKISSSYLPGVGAMRTARDKDGNELKDQPPVPANVLDIMYAGEDHDIKAGVPVREIVAVEQVFDARTVPVKRIESLVLGYPDARNEPSAPVPHPRMKGADGADGAPPPTGPQGPGEGRAGLPGAGGTGGSQWPEVAKRGGGGLGAIGPRGGLGGPAGGGEGSPEAVLEANRKRYLRATDQVRRMPVAIVVVVDQSILEDVLLALANSPLRFQITQVHWTRFRGNLFPNEGGGTLVNQGGSGAVATATGTGTFGSGFGGEGRPMGPIGPAGPPGPGRSTRPTPGGEGGPAGSTSATVTEAQLTSGLIELTVYGMVSIYEKFDKPGEGQANPGGPNTPGTPASTGTTTTPPKKPRTRRTRRRRAAR